MGLGVGRRNMSMMRKLASELKRKKKIEEEKREKRKQREREKRKCLFNEKRREKYNNFFFFITVELQCTSQDKCAL